VEEHGAPGHFRSGQEIEGDLCRESFQGQTRTGLQVELCEERSSRVRERALRAPERAEEHGQLSVVERLAPGCRGGRVLVAGGALFLFEGEAQPELETVERRGARELDGDAWQ